MSTRFHIGPELAAQVYSHASIAVGLIDRLTAQHQHYVGILRVMAKEEGRFSSVDDAEAVARTSQMFEQLGAARDELQRLADDAQQQGTEALRARRRGHNVKADLSLTAPAADASVMERAVTLHVIQDALHGNCRDLGDQLQRLLVPLSKVADPAALVFAGQLERLVEQIRPPGAPRGPYAPQHL